jgi:beta-glucanase (GH16 family)
MNPITRAITAFISAIFMVFGVALSSGAITIPTTVISFTTIPKAVFGDPDISLAITETAGVTTVTSNTPDICSLSTARTVHILSAGICKLVATNPGTATYKPARAVNKSFIISKAQNILTISDFPWISMANPTADVSTTQSTGITTLISTTTKICTVTANRVQAIKVGTCTLRAANPATANFYAAKSVTRSVVIGLTSTVQPPSNNYVGPWTIRQTTFNDSNSFNNTGAADSWVANKWYHSGLRFQIAQVQIKSTTKMSYLVTDSLGRPTPNKVINLSIGKRDGGSNAKVQVGNLTTTGADKSPLDQLLVTGTTNSLGVVSFDIIGLDTTPRAGLYTQIAAWITGLGTDTIDITNLEYSIAAGGTSGGGTSGGGTSGGGTTPTRTLLFSDEFNGASGTGPDSANWTPDLGNGCNNPAGCGWGNGESQAYASCANKADGSGSMIITASTTAGDASCTSSNAWTSGKFTSYGKKTFTYGYFEARLKMPAGGGTWPAFWALGSNINTVPWPDCGELDIVEYAGNNPTVSTGAFHYKNAQGNHDYKMGALNSGVSLAQAYHTYGMLWLPTEITLYIDDRQVATVKKSDTGLTYWPFGPNANGVNPKMYIIFNLAMGGSYGGGIQNGLTKAQFSIDYFRYYSSNGYGSAPTN